jgi:hypothetical protein
MPQPLALQCGFPMTTPNRPRRVLSGDNFLDNACFLDASEPEIEPLKPAGQPLVIDAHDCTPNFQYAAIAGMVETMAGCSLDTTLLRESSHSGPTRAVADHPR